jgi:hypothetical protein
MAPCSACRTWNRRHGVHPPPSPAGFTSEKALQEAVRRLALDHGWLYFHVADARKSPYGFPDTVVVRGERLLFAELKMPEKKPTPTQQRWLDGLAQVTQVSVALWRPDDWPQIVEVLR